MTTIGIIDKHLPPITLEPQKRKKNMEKRKNPPDIGDSDASHAECSTMKGKLLCTGTYIENMVWKIHDLRIHATSQWNRRMKQCATPNVYLCMYERHSIVPSTNMNCYVITFMDHILHRVFFLDRYLPSPLLYCVHIQVSYAVDESFIHTS